MVDGGSFPAPPGLIPPDFGPYGGGPGGIQNVVIICVASTSGGVVTLTPPRNVQWLGRLTSQQVLGFIADATPTGNISITIGSSGQIPVYVGTTLATDGDLSLGDYCQVGYDPELGASGGFHLLNWSNNGGHFVRSVGLSGPGEFTISGSPVTSTGTLGFDWAVETANRVLAGPTTGANAKPSFRALVGADLPTPQLTALGGVKAFNGTAHQWVASLGTDGAFVTSQPAAADLSNGVSGSGAVALVNGPTLINLPAPVNAGDAVNKAYADNLAGGFFPLAPVDAATVTTLPANTYANGAAGVGATLTGNSNGALAAQDGVTLTVGQSLLVQNEATQSHNGIYTLTTVGTGGTPYVLTRRTDYDTSAEIKFGTFTGANGGTANGGKSFIMNTSGTVTVGTTSVVFVPFNVGTIYTNGNGISIIGNVIAIVSPVSIANGGWNATSVGAGRLNFTLPVYVTNLAALAALSTTNDKVAIVYTAGGVNGTFAFNSANLSAQVTADTQKAIYVAPASDPTGASGAWVRVYGGAASIYWFGAVGDGVTDDFTALQAAAASGIEVYLPAAVYATSQAVVISNSTKLVGASAYWKRRAGYDSTTANATIIKYIGAPGALTCVMRVSHTAVGTKGTDFTPPLTDDLVNIVLHDIHVNGNGLAQYGWYMYRCGGNGAIYNLTAEGCVFAGIVMLGVFAAKWGEFGSYTNAGAGFSVGVDLFGWGTGESTCFEILATFDMVGNGTDHAYVAGTATDLLDSGGVFTVGRGSQLTIFSETNYGRAFVILPVNSAADPYGPVVITPAYLEGNGDGPYIEYRPGTRNYTIQNAFIHTGQDITIQAKSSAGAITTDAGPEDPTQWLVLDNICSAGTGVGINIDSNTSRYYVNRCGQTVVFVTKTPSPQKVITGFPNASVTGTVAETALADVNFPCKLLGTVGAIRVTMFFSHTNNANNKTLRLRWLDGTNNTVFTSITVTAMADSYVQSMIQNANSETAQIGVATALIGPGSSASAVVNGAINTTIATTLRMTGLLANTGDTITLKSYTIEILAEIN